MDNKIIRGFGTTTNSSDDYSVTLSVGDTALVNGGIYQLYLNRTNTTTATTLNVNSIGAKTIKKDNNTTLQIGDLQINSWVQVIYDSGNDVFHLLTTPATNKLQQTFANDAARAAAAPNFIGEVGEQIDTRTTYHAYGTSAGEWRLPANTQVQSDTYAVASGTNTYALTLSPALVAYAAGNAFNVLFTNSNTTAATINVNSLGAKAITKSGSTALVSGDIAGGTIYRIVYDGTRFQIDNSGYVSAPTITVTNTVYVSKGGNDTTGLAERFDRPFETLAAGFAAAQGLTPSATKVIRIVVLSGTYDEQIPLETYIDWDLTNAIIDFTTDSATYTINDNGSSIACNIYGNGIIKRTIGASGLGCIKQSGLNSNIKINCTGISAEVGDCIVASKGRQTINTYSLGSAAGKAIIAENSGSGVYPTYQRVTVQTGESNGTSNFASISGNTGVIENTGGNQYIHADLVSVLSGGSGKIVTVSGGTTNLYVGEITGTDTVAQNPVLCSGGTLRINGSRITATEDEDCVEQTGAGVLILKNCTLLASGAGVSIANSSAVQLQGYNDANVAVGTSVTLTGGGTLTINSGTT